MSTLQLSLAVIGALILLACIACNAWLLKRSKPRQPSADATKSVGDPLTLDDRLDPEFDAAAFHAMDDEAVLHAASPAERKGVAFLDPLIDAICPIFPELASVPAAVALHAMPPTRRVGSKPFLIEGINVATQNWEPPVAGQHYSRFQAGVQLSNRTGALNELEYSEFVKKVQAFADAINAETEFPDMLEVLENAQSLDKFCSAHDAQLAFLLRARQTPWSPGYIVQHAGQLGFVSGVRPGRMVLPAQEAGAPAVLVLNFDSQAAMAEDLTQSAVNVLTLSFDVPQTRRDEQPYIRMCEIANALAQSMDGVITDDAGTVLSMESMQATGRDLDRLYDELVQREIPAGHALARRLFS